MLYPPLLCMTHCRSVFLYLWQMKCQLAKVAYDISSYRINMHSPNGVTGAGYDNIDVDCCTARSILVSNVPKAVDDASADTALFLILAALRGFNNGILAIRNRTWTGHVPPPPIGHDPQGKVLGILGMGGIGRNLKKKAEVFGMKVVYHNRARLTDDLADGAEYVSFDELLARSDVLSVHVPLNVSRLVESCTTAMFPFADWNYVAGQNSKLDL
jgi:lactate dehydrogenase-like 2-hydroxyacid dehydrogenase